MTLAWAGASEQRPAEPRPWLVEVFLFSFFPGLPLYFTSVKDCLGCPDAPGLNLGPRFISTVRVRPDVGICHAARHSEASALKLRLGHQMAVSDGIRPREIRPTSCVGVCAVPASDRFALYTHCARTSIFASAFASQGLVCTRSYTGRKMFARMPLALHLKQFAPLDPSRGSRISSTWLQPLVHEGGEWREGGRGLATT